MSLEEIGNRGHIESYWYHLGLGNVYTSAWFKRYHLLLSG